MKWGSQLSFFESIGAAEFSYCILHIQKASKLLQPEISCFAWCLFHEETPTSIWAKSIGIQLASSYQLCFSHQEKHEANLPHPTIFSPAPLWGFFILKLLLSQQGWG